MLIEQTQKYLVETEKEATELIEDFKSSAIKYDNLIEKIYQRMEKNSNKVLSY